MSLCVLNFMNATSSTGTATTSSASHHHPSAFSATENAAGRMATASVTRNIASDPLRARSSASWCRYSPQCGDGTECDSWVGYVVFAPLAPTVTTRYLSYCSTLSRANSVYAS